MGEAVAALSRIAPEAFAAITRARRVVEFRNLLTHAYPAVDDAVVWAIIEHDVPVLRRECEEHLRRAAPPDKQA